MQRCCRLMARLSPRSQPSLLQRRHLREDRGDGEELVELIERTLARLRASATAASHAPQVKPLPAAPDAVLTTRRDALALYRSARCALRCDKA